jgi:twitching motility protein PilU
MGEENRLLLMYLTKLFKLMSDRKASDLFVSCGAPIHIKVGNQVLPISTQTIDPATANQIASELMTPEQQTRFANEWEMNLSHIEPMLGNFRINILRQRGTISMVIRFIRADIPVFETLKLPSTLIEHGMARRGLVLIVGSTGSGKSTTMASLIDYRNQRVSGHILTIEDPIEYLMQHKRSIVNQREIGVDTRDYENALVNALREAPDLLMIGEIRERSVMHHAITHALTGNLCLSTLHATNAYHALSRIINMYPQESRSGLLADLSYGLRAIIAQRLVRNKKGELQPAVEVLLNTQLIAELISSGNLDRIKEAMEQSLSPGSQTFEQSLSRMVLDGSIELSEALSASDSPTNLTWLINHARLDNQTAHRDNKASPNADFDNFKLNK